MAKFGARMMLAMFALTMAGAPASSEPATIRAAVAASSARSADNLKLDAGRKPAELLAFLGLERGMRVLDPFGGNLYWAEIIAPAVGPKGRLIIWQPSQFLDAETTAKIAAFAARQKNAAMMSSRFEAPSFAPNAYDFALINLDYHDVYWQSTKFGITRMEPDAWLRVLYATMKPGAVVGIVDHAANAGADPRVTVEATHRIDPAVVRADFARAGFFLEGESDLLRNPADDHSLSVFDAKIRGRTDRFVFKFRKPAR